MTISVRDTIEEDLSEIMRIRSDPLVQPHQFRLTANAIDDLREALFGSQVIKGKRPIMGWSLTARPF
jgi:hypothetical protein